MARWIAETPLWQRYGFTKSKAREMLHQGLAAGDLLLGADLAAREGRACGLAWCLPHGGFGRSPYLRLLGVRPDLVGHGIGRALLDAVESHFTGEASALFLLVSDFNHPAQRFYRRQGYVQAGTLPDYVREGVTELLFWKRL